MGKQFTFNTTSAEQGNVYLRSTALPHYRQSAADEDQFHSFHVTPRVLLRGAKHRSLAVIRFKKMVIITFCLRLYQGDTVVFETGGLTLCEEIKPYLRFTTSFLCRESANGRCKFGNPLFSVENVFVLSGVPKLACSF